jgi:RimJ/RimL family protein N-acetyltransferase
MYYGDLVCLRAVQSSDVEHVMQHYNNIELRRFLGVPLPRSRNYLQAWIEKQGSSNPWLDGVLHLSIADKNTGEFLGFANLKDIVKPHSRAELGISIYDPNNQSKGYGTDAVRVILWVAFNILGLHSIFLDVIAKNERAIHVYEKVGFKRVGILRESEFLDGAYTNLLYMDILKEDFLAANPDFSVELSQLS